MEFAIKHSGIKIDGTTAPHLKGTIIGYVEAKNAAAAMREARKMFKGNFTVEPDTTKGN